MIAQTVGRFTLLRKLPAGGMGRVFEADDPLAARRIALKLIDLGADHDSMQIVAAERLGAELQKRLSDIDPRVTVIYETGELPPDYFFIAMEYVEGQDLSELMRGGVPAEWAARIACEVLEVLDHAHNFPTSINGRQARGIVHGDVKPRNIRILPSGAVKVLDFGIAKALSMTRTYTSNMFGSVAYSSPERLSSGEVNVSSDLWAVAVVLYEMLAGHAYFEADTPSVLEFLIRNYRELRPLPIGVPEQLGRTLSRALSPDLSRRFQTASDFASSIRAFLNGDLTLEAEDEATRRIFAPQRATNEATQRATPPQDTEATRRIQAGTAPASTGAGSKPASRKVVLPRASFKSVLRLLTILFAAAVLWGVYMAVSEYRVWRDADTLARDIASERLQNLDTAWTQYQKISARSNAGMSLWSAQGALRDRLMRDAERVLAQSRQPDAPTVTESDWNRVRTEVARALQLEPNDTNVRGTLRLIDGNLERIHGGTRHDAKLLEQSREDFDEAARDLKRSPDPWLGLARLYIYSLHDVEHGEAAIREAERRGHEIGKRETSEIADGYRFRAEQAMRVGDKAQTDADAQRYYDIAREDVAKARKMYESLVPWDGSVANLKKLDEDLMHMSQASSRPEPQ